MLQNIIISNPSFLSFSQNHLVISQKQQEDIKIALENINNIVLESKEISITSFLLQKCAEFGVSIFSCDQKHLPNGVFNSFNTHHRSAKITKLQIALKKVNQKKIWQQIVKNKITSQAFILKQQGSDNWKILANYCLQVKSGDSSNIEAKTAKTYWQSLFKNFVRFSNDKQNAMLNYGYTILRSNIAKQLVASGFHPAIGLFHCNQFNNFNLADDIIEVFRYIIDNLVVKKLGKEVIFAEITKKDKEVIFSIFEQKIPFNGVNLRLTEAIKEVIESLQRVVKSKNQDTSLLNLPIFDL